MDEVELMELDQKIHNKDGQIMQARLDIARKTKQIAAHEADLKRFSEELENMKAERKLKSA